MKSLLIMAALVLGADEDMSTDELRDEIRAVQAQTDQYIADNAELEVRIGDLEARLEALQGQITESEFEEHADGSHDSTLPDGAEDQSS